MARVLALAMLWMNCKGRQQLSCCCACTCATASSARQPPPLLPWRLTFNARPPIASRSWQRFCARTSRTCLKTKASMHRDTMTQWCLRTLSRTTPTSKVISKLPGFLLPAHSRSADACAAPQPNCSARSNRPSQPLRTFTSCAGYLFNIAFLKRVFQPNFVLHDVRRTGPLELTTRWTMDMSLAVGPQ